MSYTQVYEADCGGWVWQHELHSLGEIVQNLAACKILANHGYKIQMLPYLEAGAIEERKLWIPDAFQFKNPDIRINEITIADIKTPSGEHPVTRKCINRAVYSAGQQKVEVVVINLNGRDYTINEVKKGIVGALQPNINKSIQEAWIITKGENIFRVNRKIVFSDSIYEALEAL